MTAIATALIGAAMLLLPLTIANIFLTHSMNEGAIFVRFLGSSLVGYSYLNWYTAHYDHFMVMRATIIGNVSTLCIALVVSIIGVISGVLNVWGLLIVALHLVLVIGFGYYLLRLTKHTSSSVKTT